VQITLTGTGKKFNNEWIFRDIDYTFEDHRAYAILGRNGSGKSTLLQVVAGSLHPTSGTLRYTHQGKEIPSDEIYSHLAIVAPYQELIEDFNFRELLDFHFSFKSLLPGLSVRELPVMLGFDAGKIPLRLYSSGMKQRVKLALAVFSDVPVLLLDEPSMNLDQQGIDWYLNILEKFSGNRTILICSNDRQQETTPCTGKLFIEDYKR
jgi:ABC-type multidrug transport system ATPase subunit